MQNGLPLLDFRATLAPEQACRLRRGRGYEYETIPLGEPMKAGVGARSSKDKTTWTSFVPGAVFVLAMLAYVVTGLLCISFPPEATQAYDEHEIPVTAKCLRVSRHSNFVSVDVIIGTSGSMLNLLLRLDIIKQNNATAMRLFSNRIAESGSVSCEGTLCTDLMLVHTEGPTSPQKQAVVGFEYTNPTTESLTYGTAVTMGLDGEFALNQGYDYFLTTTHLCWAAAAAAAADSADTAGAVPAHVIDGLLKADAAGLEQTVAMRATPAARAHTQGTCAGAGGVGEVALFPGAAADETRWLGLSSERVYESSPDNVDDRRTVVEVGTSCASNHSSYERAYSIYQLDCLSAYVPCDTLPSVPFRRAASDQLRIHLPDDGSNLAYVFTTPDSRLESLPKLEEGSHAMWLSLVKLGLMTLAAAVTWIRAGKGTASLDRLFLHCLRMAYCPLLEQTSGDVEYDVIWEDAAVGFAALAARFATAIWRTVSLSVDGQMRTPVAQLVASVLSLVQWFLRYFVLDRKCEAPLTKLGGSTALVDATTAVMLGFAEPPLFVSSISRFDPTARLLTALLITTMTLHRCLFATSCCGLLWAVATDDVAKPVEFSSALRVLPGATSAAATARFAPEYVPYVLFALIAWILQTCSVAILLADIFCVPLAHSMSRSIAGGWGELAMVIFVATTAAGMPQMLRTVLFVAKDPVVRAKKSAQ